MNRSGRWLLAVGVGGLAACTVPDLSKLGPYACEDSSSCAPGYSCVQGVCSTAPGDATPSPPVGGDVDSGTPDTPSPVLTLSIPSPTNRTPVGKTTYTETGTDGTPLPAAWRRDQTVSVVLSTSSSLPLTLTLTGTDGQPVPVDVVPYTTGCDSLQCARADLPLWKPRLDAERGAFTLLATAKDAAGHTTVQKASVPVTRWKWAYDVYDASARYSYVDATPAIGATGTVYVTAYLATLSALVALSPEGLEVWPQPLSAQGPVVVGNPSSGREILYARNFWTTSTRGVEGNQLAVYDAASAATTTTPLLLCPSTQITKLYISSQALGNLASSTEEVIAPTSGDADGSLLELSATRNSGRPQCTVTATSLKDSGRGNTIFRNGVIYFTGPSDEATSVTVGSGTPRSGWPVTPTIAKGTNGLAQTGDTLVMSEGYIKDPTSAGAFSTVDAVAGGTALQRYKRGPYAAPIIGPGNYLFGVDAQDGRLVRTPMLANSEALLSQETGLDSTLTPTLGQGGFLYALFPSEVGVWSAADLTLQWRWSVGSVSTDARRAAPALDCTRDSQGVPLAGRPGVLYASLSNRLYALVVDSAGLDADAPWPKYQHDERNTGNPSFSTLRCP